MIRQQFCVAGDPVTINTLESPADLPEFRDWFQANGRAPIACDTEGTGLNVYGSDFRLRMVQFGDGRTAWVLPADRFRGVISAVLAHEGYHFVFHNAPFDLLTFQATGVADARELVNRVEDTKIAAHLIDPRGRDEGGIGLGLKANSAEHVDPGAPDTQSGLHAVFQALDVCSDGEVIDLTEMDTKDRAKLRKQLREDGRNPRRIKVDEGWRHIPTFHPIYTLYAGLDVILTRRLHDVLTARIKRDGMGELYRFEHEVLRACVRMQIRGLRADVGYLRETSDKLAQTAREHEKEAANYGVTKIGAPRQVAAALERMGETLRETTETGNPKVDKAVLTKLADAGNPLAREILAAKRAEKWRTAYVERMLNGRDANDRVHPDIKSLQARTARMSAGIFQQLPSSDVMVRDGVIADDGYVLVSSDYDQIEMRVSAAFAQEPAMIQAARDGVSIHKVTAALVFGDNYDAPQYKIAKNVGFGSVYGGGAPTLSRQAGISMEQAQSVVSMFREAYPELARYKRDRNMSVLEDALTADEMKTYLAVRQQFFDAEDEDAKQDYKRQMSGLCAGKYATITTPIGRRLPVEAEFAYKVVNYEVQSTSRDILCQALLRLDASGLADYLLLPIHDEVLAQAPADRAEEVAREIGQIMTTEFRGVPVTAGGEVYGPRWGDGYRGK